MDFTIPILLLSRKNRNFFEKSYVYKVPFVYPRDTNIEECDSILDKYVSKKDRNLLRYDQVYILTMKVKRRKRHEFIEDLQEYYTVMKSNKFIKELILKAESAKKLIPAILSYNINF